MQFKVPQFLDIEDKIFGPFTFSEFVYLVGGGGLCYIFYKLFGLFFGFIPILLVGGFAGALVFYKPNGKPFINMVEASLKYFFQNKLYIWKKENKPINKDIYSNKLKSNEIESTHHIDPRLGKSKLRDLAWSLDVLDLKK